MASPLPSRWSTSCSSYKPSFPSSSSIFFQFHIIPTKRHRITTSLLDSSSSTSPNPKRRLRRFLNSEFSNPKLLTTDCNTENEVSVETVGSQNGGTLCFQTLFGRRSLWRGILFASKRVRSVILLNVITIVYASNIPILKEVEASMDPAAFTVARFTVSAIPFTPFVLRARGDVETRNAGIELGFWVSLGYLMQTLGLLTSEAGRASFISMFTVIVVPLLDGMLGAIVPARTWFGVLMPILGVAMLECSGSPPNFFFWCPYVAN